MARKLRFKIAGVAQLITQRGINGQAVFFSDQDYLYYLSILNETAIKQDCQIHAFVLMSNKIHILATPSTPDGISQLMKGVGQRYVSYINAIEKRSGTLWQGRYKASLVESGQYLLACMRYIEMAPVRASIVKIPKNYQWSSYKANAQGQDAQVKITQHESYSSLEPWIDKIIKKFKKNTNNYSEGNKMTKNYNKLEKR
jgi:Transposase and inactivated derivatives